MDRPKVKKDKRLVKKTETVNEILTVDVDVLSCSCAAPPQSYFEIGSQIVAQPQFEFYPGPGGGKEVDSVTGTVTVEGDAPSSQYFSPAAGPYVSSDYWFGGNSVNGDSTFADQPWTAPGLPPLIYMYGVSDQVTDTMSNYMFYTGPSPTPTTQTFLITPIISATASVSGSASAQASLTDDFGDTASVSQNFQPQYNYTPHLVTISPDQSTGIASYTFNAYYTSASYLVGAGRAAADISEAFAMKPDNRTLSIFYPTFYKWDTGQQDQWGNEVYAPKEHLPSKSGNDTADIGIADSDASSEFTTDITITPSLGGSWTLPGASYVWTEPLCGDGFSGSVNPPFSSGVSPLTVSYANLTSGTKIVNYDPLTSDPIYDVPSPGTTGNDVITLKLSDGYDKATATATLDVTVHNPLENPVICLPKPSNSAQTLPAVVSSPGYSTAQNDVLIAYSSNPGDIVGNFCNWVYTVGYPSLPNGIQSILTAIGATPQQFASQAYPSVTVPFWDAWDHPSSDPAWNYLGNVTSSPPPGAEQQASQGLWKFEPIEECLYTTTNVSIEHYVGPESTSGYVGYSGQVNESASVQYGLPYASGTYVYVGTDQH